MKGYWDNSVMLCNSCQAIFSGERLPKLDGSYSYLHYWLPDLMRGMQQRCFICAVLKRALSSHGKLEKLIEPEGVLGYIVEYMMRPGAGDQVEIVFKARHDASRLYYRMYRRLIVHPWNGTNSLMP